MSAAIAPIALVTGASRGFGFAVAQALGSQGWHIVAMARTVGGLEDLDDRIKATGGHTTLVPLDITDDDGLARLCRSVFDRWGRLDLLVHCAIFAGPLSPAEHVPEKDWDRMVAVNIHATQRLVAMTDPLLRMGDGGTAVLPCDDIAGKKFFAAYGASKAAQRAIWESWAAETKNTGPNVVTVTPKAMPTALRARFFPGESRDALFSPASQAEKILGFL